MADENIFKAVFDDSDALRFLDNIEKKLGSVGAEADDLKSTLHAAFNEIKSDAKVTGDALGSAFQIGTAQGLTDALKNLQKEYSDLRNASNTLKTSLKSATDPTLVKLYARGIADLEVGMKRLETAGGAAGVNLKKLNESAGTGKQVFEGLFGAIGKAALILGAIEAVRKFVSYAVELSTQITAAKRSIEAFTGSAEEADKIVNSLVATGQKNFIPTDQILKAGKALLAFGENADDLPGVLTRIANVSAATGKNFGELTTIYGKARAAGVLYAEDINQLVDAGIPIIGEFAKQLGVSGAEVKKLASEGKISFEELQLAMFNLTAQGGKFADQAAVQSESIGGAWNKLVATVTPAINTIGTAFSSIVQSGINKLNGLLEFASDVAKRIANGDDYINVSNAGREKADQDASRAQFEKDIDERLRLEKEAADKRNVVVKKSAGELAKAERDREALRISAMKDGLDKELAQEDFRFKELVKQLKKYHLDTSDAEAQHNDNIRDIRLNDIDRQYADIQKSLEIRRKINEADIKATEQVAKDKKEDVAGRVAELEAVRDLKNQEVELSEEYGKRLIEELRKRGASEAQIKEGQRLLDVETQKSRLQNELDFQLAFLETIDAGNTAQLNATLASIDVLKAKISNAGNGAGDGTKPNSIWSLFGTDDEDGKQRFENSMAIIIDGLGQIADARVKEAEAAVKAAEDKVRAAEDALAEEEKFAKDGVANNTNLLKLQLDNAKKARDIALKDEEKARKQQILLDSATQLSSLVTAAANIFKGFSTIPILGQVLAVASVAAMFVSFAAAKSSAIKAASVPKLRKGDKIQGRTHEQGGELRELEHNEQVVGAAESENQDLFFQRMRQGRYRGLDLAKIAERQENPLSHAAGRIHTIEQRRAAVMESQHAAAMARVYETVGQKIVAAIEAKPVVYPTQKGYKVELKSNGVTEIKKVNFVD